MAVKAIKIITKKFYTSSNENSYDNRYLNKWVLCDFCGEEAFVDVTSSLSNNISGIDDYIGYLQKKSESLTWSVTRKCHNMPMQ